MRLIPSCGCAVLAVVAVIAAGAAGALVLGGGGDVGAALPAAAAVIDDGVTTTLVAGAAAGMVRPVAGGTVSQRFGCTAFAAEPPDPGCPGGHIHLGIDLAAPLGTPVVAALGGAAHVVRSPRGYGLHVVVTSSGGLSILYGHLSAVEVADGEVVAAGESLGRVGSTGNSTGPHLHFEVRRLGIALDPADLVALP